MILKAVSKMFVFSVLVSFMFCAYAFGEDSINKETKEYRIVEKVLELNGTREQMKQITALVQARFAEYKNKLPDDKFAKLMEIIIEAFEDESMYHEIAKVFVDNYDERRFKSILKWFQSSIGKKMTRLEVEASTPRAQDECKLFVTNLKLEEVSDKRESLIKRLDNSAHITDISLQLMGNSFLATARAANSALPLENQRDEEQLKELRDDFLAKIKPGVKNYNFMAELFMYRSAKEREIKKYIAFYESENGRWYARIIEQALTESMTKIMEKICPQIQQLFKGEIINL